MPQKRGELEANQIFAAAERLYRRVPPECLSPSGELVPSHIRCSYGDAVKKSPSVVRSKYASEADVLHVNCAMGKDVSDNFVIFIVVDQLPQSVTSGNKELFDFYPLHDPEEDCYAHTLVACKKQTNVESNFDEPTDGVRNKLKALFVSAFRQQIMKN